MLRLGALAMAVGVAVPAFAASINLNFCDCAASIPLEALAPYAPLLVSALSPDADMNGESSMDVSPPFKCQVGGNAIPDCSCELGLVSELLRNQALDFTASGGVSHQMVYETYTHNYAVLRAYMDVDDYNYLLLDFQSLLALIYGYLAIGDGDFEEVAPNEFGFSGSGGCALSLIYALPTTVPIAPGAFSLANYARLPQYLGSAGDADGDGYTNAEEFTASSSNTDFVAGALDPSRCGSQFISGGEGEGEGQEGEGETGGEGEGESANEGEGEGEPADPAMPAMTGFAAVCLFLALMAGSIFLALSRKAIRLAD